MKKEEMAHLVRIPAKRIRRRITHPKLAEKIGRNKVYSGVLDLPKGHASDRITMGCVVIEGGAFRGLYNQGVLDALMENDINLSCTIGVSAGALAGLNYVSGQIGRSARANLNYRHDSEYIGAKAIRESHSLLNIDFLFEDHSAVEALDRDAFYSKRRRFCALATDCLTGQPVVFERDLCGDILTAIKASASMPYLSPMVSVDGRLCLDGGCSCNIPYQWAIDEGYEKIIVIKTRENGFRKVEKESHTAERIYHKYPDFAMALEQGNARYNRECERIEELSREGRIYVIAPSRPPHVGRIEPDMEKLGELYWLGYQDAMKQMDEIKDYLGMTE